MFISMYGTFVANLNLMRPISQSRALGINLKENLPKLTYVRTNEDNSLQLQFE